MFLVANIDPAWVASGTSQQTVAINRTKRRMSLRLFRRGKWTFRHLEFPEQTLFFGANTLHPHWTKDTASSIFKHKVVPKFHSENALCCTCLRQLSTIWLAILYLTTSHVMYSDEQNKQTLREILLQGNPVILGPNLTSKFQSMKGHSSRDAEQHVVFCCFLRSSRESCGVPLLYGRY